MKIVSPIEHGEIPASYVDSFTRGVTINKKINPKVVDIAVGSFHSCAVLDNGGMKCWGYGRNGQLGQGDVSGGKIQLESTFSTFPLAVKNEGLYILIK